MSQILKTNSKSLRMEETRRKMAKKTLANAEVVQGENNRPKMTPAATIVIRDQ